MPDEDKDEPVPEEVEEEIVPEDVSEEQSDKKATPTIVPWRLCYILIAVAVFAIVFSLGLGLWWSITRNDVGAGFTIAAYVVAVAALPVASIQIRHNKSCRCWDRIGEVIPVASDA